MGETTVRRRVVVRGRVQGVFFRDTCRQQAEDAGVRGWVRNRADGSVEAVFEGAEPAVERLVRWARQGPPQAEVEGMEVYDETAVGEPRFSVR